MHPHVRAHHWARMFENRHKSGETSSDDSLDTPDPPHSKTEDEPVPTKQDNGFEEGGVNDEDLWMLIRRFNKVSQDTYTALKVTASQSMARRKYTMSNRLEMPYRMSSTLVEAAKTTSPRKSYERHSSGSIRLLSST